MSRKPPASVVSDETVGQSPGDLVGTSCLATRSKNPTLPLPELSVSSSQSNLKDLPLYTPIDTGGKSAAVFVGQPIRVTPSQHKTLQAQYAQEKQLRSQIQTEVTNVLGNALAFGFETPMRMVVLTPEQWDLISFPIQFTLDSAFLWAESQIGKAHEKIQQLQRQSKEQMAQNQELTRQLKAKDDEIRRLTERLNLNSTNSSKPPSSDSPFNRPASSSKAVNSGSKRRRGGQPNHPKHTRPLVPPENVAATHEVRPQACSGCSYIFNPNSDISSSPPTIHQHIELPPIRPIVTEYRVHTLTCPECGQSNCGAIPPEHQAVFGPRLQRDLSFLAASHMTKRKIVEIADCLLHTPISLGMIPKLENQTSEALKPVVDELRDFVKKQPVVNVDETSWRENKKPGWVWAAAAPKAVVYLVAQSRKKAVAQQLVNGDHNQVVSTDRYSAYNFARIRQVCWEHLGRDFQAMVDRGGEGQEVGEKLLAKRKELFKVWHKFKRGEIKRATFESYARSIRPGVKRWLERGAKDRQSKTGSKCRGILKLEEWMWTFARVRGVEPTNNYIEQQIRDFAIRRKISYGTDSEKGSRFVERLSSIKATCKRQSRNFPQFLEDCIRAKRAGNKAPSLLPMLA